MAGHECGNIKSMVCRRTIAAFLLGIPLVTAGEFDRLAGRWRSRITVVRSGRASYTRLRITISTAGGFALEEFAAGGALVWVYKGILRLTAEQELFLEVSSVTDSNGATPEDGRARYQPGESYNLGVVDYISAARVRVGALELQKELE